MMSVTCLCAQAKAQEVRNNKDYAETTWGEESEALDVLKRDSAVAAAPVAKEAGAVNGPSAGAAPAPASMKGKARTTRCMGSTMGMKVGLHFKKPRAQAHDMARYFEFRYDGRLQ